MKIIFLFLTKYKRRLLLGAACLAASNILLLANPWILKIIIDSLKTGISRNRLLNLSLFFVGITTASGLFRFLMRRIMIGVSRKIEFDLRKEFFEHLEKLSPEFYLQNRTGDLMALATNDLNAVRALVGPGVMYSLNTIVVACLAVTLMVILSIKLTVLALIPMALLSLAVYNSVKTIHKLFEKVQEKFAGLNSRSQENLSGIRVIKAFAREEHETDVFREMSSSYVKQNMKLVKIQSLLMPMLTFVSGIGMLVILAYGGKLIIDGSLSLGAFVAFNGYLTMLIWPMIAIGWVMNITQRGLASMGRINRILKTPPAITDPEDRGLKPERPQDKSIHFENVSFTYPSSPDRLPALDGISFTITQGETAAIVGPVGSGKSSLVLLLLRLFEPTQGGIFIGRTPLDRIPLEELRSLVGLVPQDIFLFSDTLRENIAFGAGGLSAKDLDKISSIAAIKDEIEGFPGKFDTLIGERGINLSGGQKQRVAIARSLAKNPGILILDDALSSVDTDTEDRILSLLQGEIEQRTSILISHRISTIQNADKIIVLDKGKIVEMGTHSQLLKAGGIYAEMYRKQLIVEELDRSL